MIVFVALLCAAEFALLIFFGALFVRRKQSTDIFRRLRRAVKMVKRAARPLRNMQFTKNMDFKLRQAGVPLFGAEFLIVAIIIVAARLSPNSSAIA